MIQCFSFQVWTINREDSKSSRGVQFEFFHFSFLSRLVSVSRAISQVTTDV